ncbi:MAG: ABC transporter ATP-binding protein [Spirochaetia bacterium]|jgi:iron complex transport system ATP-binding protein|nr:ABC transporter ATP-binding protein [Spirochaetia bacterium]
MSRLVAETLCFSRLCRAQLLSDISLSLEAGEIIAVLGANGAGKTSLLSVLAGRLKPSRGRVLIEGAELSLLSPREIARQIALLPQIERLAFNYPVLDFVLLGRAPHINALSLPGEEDYRAAQTALKEAGVAGLEGRGAASLSGGEFQLVRIARCLAQEAGILLLDEPTSLLDPAHAASVAQKLSALAKSGRAIIITTHDIGLAYSVADSVFLLHEGRLLDSGPSSRLFDLDTLKKAFGAEFTQLALPSAYSFRD